MRAVIATLTSAALLSFTAGAEAKSLRSSGGPAEVPPASYSATQYVDSKGCVYIRSGYGGNVTWVPRVTRSRQLVCGQSPSAVAGSSRPSAVKPRATRVATTPARTATTPARTAPAQTQVASAPQKPRKTFNWFWFGTPAKANTRTVAPAPTQRVVASAPTTTRVVTTEPLVTRRRGSYTIRTVPQAVHPADYANGRLGRATGQAVQVARAAPVIPAGYKSLLTNDQIASNRGNASARGQAQMDLIWTQTMPRRLIDVTTGRDVTAQLPQIRYPYTTTVSSRAYMPSSATVYAPRKKVPTNDAASPSNMEQAALEEALRGIQDVSAAVTDPVVQPKPVAQPAMVIASGQFVQVATFGVPANAERTLAKFGATGLPTQSRPLNRSGRSYDIVLLGPFTDATALKAALSQARNAGFSDAFYVK